MARRSNGNRTDLLTKPQAVQAPTGLPYGEAKQLQQSQQAQPLTQQIDPRQLQQTAQEMPAPPPIHSPTERPNEPLTSGLATGAGPGPEILNTPVPDASVNQLQGLYSKFPIDAVHRLLIEAQRRSSGG